MSDKQYLNVVLTGDEHYVMPMGVAMFSVVKNLNLQYTARFFLLISGLAEKQEQEIKQINNCEINIIHAEQYLHYSIRQSFVNPLMYHYTRATKP